MGRAPNLARNCFSGKSGFGCLGMEGFSLFPSVLLLMQPVPLTVVDEGGGNGEGAMLSKTGFLEAQHLGRDTA